MLSAYADNIFKCILFLLNCVKNQQYIVGSLVQAWLC